MCKYGMARDELDGFIIRNERGRASEELDLLKRGREGDFH